MAGCSFHKNTFKTQSDRSAVLADGIGAFRRGDYETSYRIFSAIIETKMGSPELEEAQWYLAQTAERQGKMAEARAQYTLFANNYPTSPHIAEAREIMAKLGNAPSSPDNTFQPPASPPAGAMARSKTGDSRYPYGRISGSLTTEYSYDILVSPSPAVAAQNRLSEYLDFRWKNMGANDLRVYFSGMYSYDFLIPENRRYRISKLFAEWNDLASVLNLRLGRQPSSGNTLFTRFDGISVGYRPFNAVSINAAGGFPVDTFDKNRVRLQTDHTFYDAYIALNDFHHLNGKIYATQQFDHGFSTRNAVGMNGFWMARDVVVSAILDYDIDFAKFNDQLLGVDYGMGKVHYSAAVERRENPFLDYETALFDPSNIGATPPITSFESLIQTKTRDEIRNLAAANTSESLEFRAGAAINFSKVWRGDFKVAHTINDVVDFTTGRATRYSDRYSAFVSERNGLGLSEIWTFLMLYQPGTDYKTSTALTTLSKYWSSGMAASLRLRAEQVSYEASRTRTTRLVPGIAWSTLFLGKIYGGIEGDVAMEKNNTSSDTVTSVQTRATLTIPF